MNYLRQGDNYFHQFTVIARDYYYGGQAWDERALETYRTLMKSFIHLAIN
jgi:hypothetical protein